MKQESFWNVYALPPSILFSNEKSWNAVQHCEILFYSEMRIFIMLPGIMITNEDFNSTIQCSVY